MNDERYVPSTEFPGDDEIAELIRAAGPRPDLPELELAAIRAKTCEAWEAEVRRSSSGARRVTIYRLAAAAAVGSALLLVWLLRDRTAAPQAIQVATVELVSGAVTARPGDGEISTVSSGERLEAGVTLATDGIGAYAAIRLVGGNGVRLDEQTSATLVSSSEIRLAEGAIYVETGGEVGGDGTKGIEVRTPAGVARDVGTQFEVRVLDSTPAMLVRVRDGKVEVRRDGEHREVGAGFEIVVEESGRIAEREARGWGAEWDWVLAASPGYDIEGRTLAEFLVWVGRETGWTIQFEDAAIESRARGIVLHGTIEETRPDEAPFGVLAGSGLKGVLTDDGVLTVGTSK